MTDESREAEIREELDEGGEEHHVVTHWPRADVRILLGIIDDLRARLAAVEQERDKAIDELTHWTADEVMLDLQTERDAAHVVIKKLEQELGEADETTAVIVERDAALADAKALREALEAMVHGYDSEPAASKQRLLAYKKARAALARKP